jgi:two-component system chemotaxis response regulator CheB
MTLFAALPAELAVPVFIVQHMPPLFTRLFAERLSASGRIPVQEGRPGAMVEPGMAWIAPGGYHMVVQRAGAAICLKTNLEAPENSCRPAADVLFRSVAAVYGKHVLAVVMTGMGQDGLRGCEAIRREGGQIVVQDEASSVVWGMPGFVARAGLADKIVPLGELAAEIVRRTHPAQAPAEVGSPATARASL